MAKKQQHSTLAKVLWWIPIILLIPLLFKHGYDSVKKIDWVGKPADPAVKKRAGAPRTLHELPGPPPNKRIPYPGEKLWMETIAPLANGCCWALSPLIFLLLYWLAKAGKTAHHRERGTNKYAHLPPWEIPG